MSEKPIPKWREDFPIESQGDDFITRRDFVRFLALVSAGLTVGNGFVLGKALTHHEGDLEPLDVCSVDDVQPGTWKVFNYPDKNSPAILVRKESGEFIAFHQKCTHLACPVQYKKSENGDHEHLYCHCHNGRFDVQTGEGKQGPPRGLRPLRQVILEVHDERVVAVGLNALG